VFYRGKLLTENIIHIIISQTSRMSNVLYNQYNRRLVYQITLHIESTVAKIELIIFSMFTYFSFCLSTKLQYIYQCDSIVVNIKDTTLYKSSVRLRFLSIHCLSQRWNNALYYCICMFIFLCYNYLLYLYCIMIWWIIYCIYVCLYVVWHW